MAETEGLHFQLTADSTSFNKAITNAKNKLLELAEQTKILKQGEADIKKELEKAKKQYGENSKQVQRLTADLLDNARAQEELKQEVKTANAELNNATKAYKNAANAANKSFADSSAGAKNAADSIKNGFNMVKGLIAGYAGKKLYDALIGTNAEFEQSMTSFEVLLGSAEQADEMMRSLEQLGASTPFELGDLTEATTPAFGVWNGGG